MDVEVAATTDRTPFGRALAVLVGITAVLAALLSTLEVDASRRAERSSVEASRIAVELFEDITATGLDLNFESDVVMTQYAFANSAEVRALLADGAEGAEGQAAVAAADRRAAGRLRAAGAAMIDKPMGLESLEAIAADQAAAAERLRVTLGEQNRQADLAERYGTRAGRAVYGLTLLATAGSLLGLAGVLGAGRPGVIALATGTVALAGAALTGAAALLG